MLWEDHWATRLCCAGLAPYHTVVLWYPLAETITTVRMVYRLKVGY